jgi:hypothetical protein
MLRYAHFGSKGGMRSFAAGARLTGSSSGSGPTTGDEISFLCCTAEDSSKPLVPGGAMHAFRRDLLKADLRTAERLRM